MAAEQNKGIVFFRISDLVCWIKDLNEVAGVLLRSSDCCVEVSLLPEYTCPDSVAVRLVEPSCGRDPN